MYDPKRREQLWRDYYRAMHRGDKAGAAQILSVLHNPPSGAQRPNAGRSGGCGRCRKGF